MTGHEAGVHEVGAPRQGSRIEAGAGAAFHKALHEAFEYRGDVTLRCVDGTALEGYLFDVRCGADGGPESLRVLPRDGGAARAVPVTAVAELAFTGKDPAEGRTWEAWLRRYVERKRAGLSAGIDSLPLED